MMTDQLMRSSFLLSQREDYSSLVSTLVEQSLDITDADLGAFYKFSKESENMDLLYQRGKYEIPRSFSLKDEFIRFLFECLQMTVLGERGTIWFDSLLLNGKMNSGAAIPIVSGKTKLGILFVNYRSRHKINRDRFKYIESFCTIAGEMMQRALLYSAQKEHLRKIEAMERYQESIFTSMTNLLITVDENGSIHYLNKAARDRLELNDEDIGEDLSKVFDGRIGKKILRKLKNLKEGGNELLGVEGMYTKKDSEIDFSLNVSPLKGKRGKYQGLTLLFTDQSRERELKERFEVVKEERRIVKDMFAKYLSADLVKNLMANPDTIHPGGDQKHATIFFADIRGYTSFSETKEPEEIITILNSYFNEAVEKIIQQKGFIDKFIGDCIMAAWGIPLSDKGEDAVRAVSCAVDIQKLVQSKNRSFFTGAAKDLKLGIGMHSGPLVAGNLGSKKRMDYTVIGDTVNIAARLEGVAQAGEIIITEQTRSLIGDTFILEKRKPIKVKGKSAPLEIYNVLDHAS